MAEKSIESENLNRIKEILFGDDIQGIEQQLLSLKNDNKLAFEKLKSELDLKFSQIEAELLEKNTESVKVISNNNNVQKTINEDIKQNIVQLSVNITEEKNKFEKLVKDNEVNLEERMSKFEDNIKVIINKFIEETNQKLNDINSSKINKEDLAVLFSALADNLKK